MPKKNAIEITQSEKDAEYLRTLSATNKLAAKCEYLCTFAGRFVVCYEVHNGKYIYYAVDQIYGRFSRVTEQSFPLSASVMARRFLRELIRSVWYTGCFNRIVGGGKTQVSVWTTASRA